MLNATYPDINKLVEEISSALQKILGKNLKGLYLFGSLVYGDFKEGSSDIDLVAILNLPLKNEELQHIKQFHLEFGEKHPKWKDRLECSYTPKTMLSNILPPLEPRPYYGGGVFYADADYGNEWIINNYLLSKHSLPLVGPYFDTLLKPISITEVQKACIRDLFKEWEPKITDEKWLENSHYQSYIILNLCRILYTVFCADTASKVVSAAWVKKNHVQWKQLIETAEDWEFGKTMLLKKDAIEFIQFVVNEIKKYKI